jgi:hypothetical protein
MEQLCKQKHNNNIGIVICNELHNLFHILYGRKNNMPYQFDEFKQRLYSGEFNDFLKDHNLKLLK